MKHLYAVWGGEEREYNWDGSTHEIWLGVFSSLEKAEKEIMKNVVKYYHKNTEYEMNKVEKGRDKYRSNRVITYEFLGKNIIEKIKEEHKRRVKPFNWDRDIDREGCLIYHVDKIKIDTMYDE